MFTIVSGILVSMTLLAVFFSAVNGFLPHTSVGKSKTVNQSVIPTTVPTILAKLDPTPTHAKLQSYTKLPLSAISPTKPPLPSPTKRPPGPSPTLVPTVAIRNVIRIMPMGDSITDGTGSWGGYRTDLWTRLVGEGDKVDFVGSLASGPGNIDTNHEGHVGWEIGQINIYAFNWTRLYQPDIVLLHIGSNDLDHGTSAPVMTQNLINLIGNLFAGKPDTYVVVSTIIPTTHGDKGAWTAYNASIPGVVAQYRAQGRRIVSIDMSNTLTESDLIDGLHPNSIGYSKMAGAWYPVTSTIYRELIAR